ncbi:hypothetical protein FGIG_02515 [Fasciola gigantica]|uniref:FAM194 C-terminal domain-containing protein n=1 Tax=Fasciola gigantica TaxID=46835 RepID=A0A504YTC7_FASGI|nr:hypothetical protein FGIG_02515 [Fasciola gigantica]
MVSYGLLCLIHDIGPALSTLTVTPQMRSKRARRRAVQNVGSSNPSFPKPAIAGRLLAVLNSNGQGTIYRSDGSIRLHYNTNGGVQFSDESRPRGTRRQWQWSGKPHVHAPPFQPIVLRLNAYLTVRIVDRKRIHVHFQRGEQRCRIDVAIPNAQIQDVLASRVLLGTPE